MNALGNIQHYKTKITFNNRLSQSKQGSQTREVTQNLNNTNIKYCPLK